MATKVLIAHSVTQRLKLAVAALQKAGFEVVATPDGGDAFARFFEEQPDLVICSQLLAGLSGDNFARMVRAQSPSTPVVILLAGEHPIADLDGPLQLPEPLDIEVIKTLVPDYRPPATVVAGDSEYIFSMSALKHFRRHNDILSLLDEAGLQRLAQIATQRTYDADETVIREGDLGAECYFLVEGQVRITLEERDGAEVARLNPGGFFGEMALLSDARRSASVLTVGECTLLRFSRADFLPFLEAYPDVQRRLQGVALQRSEENLWKVLFDDGFIQETFKGLSEEATARAAAAAPRLPQHKRDSPSPPPLPARRGGDTDKMPPSATPGATRHTSSWHFAAGVAVGLMVGITLARSSPPDEEHPSPALPPSTAPHPSADIDGPPPAAAQDLTAERKALRADMFDAYRKKDFALASRLGDDLAQRFAMDWEAHFTVAQAHRRADRDEHAIEVYRSFFAKYPTNVYADDAIYWAARLLAKRGEGAKARALYEQLLQNGGDRAEDARKRLEMLPSSP